MRTSRPRTRTAIARCASALLKGPEGLTRRPRERPPQLAPGPGHGGHHPVEVAVADSFGAESALGFELNVSASAPREGDSACEEERGRRGDDAEESEE